jgi:hypothetical protein
VAREETTALLAALQIFKQQCILRREPTKRKTIGFYFGSSAYNLRPRPGSEADRSSLSNAQLRIGGPTPPLPLRVNGTGKLFFNPFMN